MSNFIPLKDRIDNLPTILAGPIVRKVHTQDTPDTFDNITGLPIKKKESAGVTIWLAMRENRKVGLQIFNKDDGSFRGPLEQADPIQIGDNLYIVILTSKQEFQFDSKYYYNILFSEVNSSSSVTWNDPVFGQDITLLSQNIISTDSSESERKKIICYPGEPYPFFQTPSLDIDKVKIAHLSCRKPHGGEKADEEDAFVHLDNKNELDKKYPQQLFMTGDQIYADDVDASLLFLIQDAIPVLYSETYNPETKFFGGIPSENFDIGQREQTVIDFAKFTHEDGHAQNHLIHESEYYLMYLFVWSDVLWPDYIPNYQESIEFSGLEKYDYYNIHYRNVRGATKIEFEEDINSALFEDNGCRLNPKKNYSHIHHIRQFSKDIHAARRVLANVSTYMMFDDHDVTDDWFITQKWTRGVLGDGDGTGLPVPSKVGTDLGKYIISNGLMAYALFQGFGNKPQDFLFHPPSIINQVPRVKELPFEIAQWYQNVVKNGGTGTLSNLRKTIDDIILPKLTNDDNSTYQNSTGHRLDSLIDWNFYLDCGAYSIVVLDTRTKRGFSDNDGASALISSANLKTQIPNRQFYGSQSVTFLISPAPVIGFEGVEQVQHAGKPLVGIPSADFEAWGFHKEAWDALLHGFVPPGSLGNPTPTSNLIILSGDVHYGFTSQVRLWDFSLNLHLGSPNHSDDWMRTPPLLSKNPWAPPAAPPHIGLNPDRHCRILNIAQLVASSAKNSAGGIKGSKFVPTLEFIGMNNEVDIISHSEDTTWYKKSIIIKSDVWTDSVKRVKFEGDDFERIVESGRLTDFADLETEKYPVRQYRVKNIWDLLAKKPARIVVGFNNVGFVEPFTKDGGGVKHSLFFSRSSKEAMETTKHEVIFNSLINLPYIGHE